MLDSSRVDIWNGKKFGLVLSGGGAKGAYEAGAFEALHELDIADKITVVSGTSVGALNTVVFAMNDKKLGVRLWNQIGFKSVLASGDKEGRAENKLSIRDTIKQIKNEKFTEDTTLSAVLVDMSRNDAGAFTQDNLRDLLYIAVDAEKITKSDRTLYACAYDIDEYKPVYFKLNDMQPDEIIDTVLASAAIPFVFPPVTINGRRYADGGVNNPAYPEKNGDVTPIKPLAEHELDAIFVIRLNKDEWEPDESFDGTPVIQIVPSRSLEPVKGAGTLNFMHGSVEDKIQLGYRDTMAVLAPWAMSQLK